MLQRIQTIYFIAALIVTALIFFVPIVILTNSSGAVFNIYYNGLWKLNPPTAEIITGSFAIPVAAIAAIVSVFAAIMSYKKRLQQIKLSWVSIVLLFIYGLTMIVTSHFLAEKNNLEIISFPWLFLTPATAMICNYLAIKAIKRDEKLVRSVDRLR